ncbi:ATP-dependent DNA helicase pcrA [Drepanopeziza brunnea f. sp. 'multigermtubi' MB_m1]|uniref:DNA 3'-5' helicase n=1 Tax=Marssonina brunnea f. sp. multigermtubi (strain MB_m1) TaxID=1072389 RepID=K1XTH3_MARBU|nr:ATP-dependent DNA helicase pcrA [Drepanopeziza brunnea f. sp. 'multigermtubi' MB_m1]EKD15854.1 ATP-dependent DNA helicase pcrA [Drepanopeziza brunnea f. sp. 'multigermtubi' MB_m1]
MNPDGLLTNLNQSQQAAVSSFADTLAILAGPGSGKTHTLTSRTAWLLAQGLQPWNVIVATFTVKAAREMKERIGKLIGNGTESKLILGTFHSIARRYLARYGHLIDIKKDFGIADSADSLAIIKRIVKRHRFMIDAKVVRSRISGLKARTSVDQEVKSQKKFGAKIVEEQEFEKCYEEYEEALRRSNLLDYDDLLLRCVDLLRMHPSCVSNVEAVLIDEFQDTNLVQFDLMRLFAAQRKRITIVGDPDQSIYGFRAAEIKNYKRMLHQYPDTVTIALEENYRSSGAILMSALSVIQQDSSRVAKSLLATHSPGTRPVLRKLSGAQKEAHWIVTEIQRIRGMTGELLDLNDFAILLRSSALSRLIETALGKAGIAYRMVGGQRFYDRLEIKTVLDYLRVINQPDNNDALARIINTPSRRIGEATIKDLLEEADQSKITLWTLILNIVQRKRTTKTKLKNKQEQNLAAFVNIILMGRSKSAGPPDERLSTSGLIQFVLAKTSYERWLEEHHGDENKARWDNVQELITQANDFEDLISFGYEDETLPEIDGLKQNDDADTLSRFLANVALASEVKPEDAETATITRITISTIHAAKGLEWPVVFIPAAYQGSIPHSRAEDTNEERRLLYVAMTRAKALLYMSCPIKSTSNEDTILSPFLTPPGLASLLDAKGPSLGSPAVTDLAQILRRNLPSRRSIEKSSASLTSTEDDLFPERGEEKESDQELRWNSMTAGTSSFMAGQQAPKRRRAELGRSMSNLEGPERDWKPSYATTMDRAASFTTAGFVTAGSHLQVLKEQSVNGTLNDEQDAEDFDRGKKKPKQTGRLPEGQGTLFGFFGKSEPQVNKPVPMIKETDPKPRAPIVAKSFNQARSKSTTSEHVGIATALSNHRLGNGTSGNRLRQNAQLDVQSHRNDYVFLSSSPPRPNPPSPTHQEKKLSPQPPPQPAGLTARPPILNKIRPPIISTHQTTVSMLQNGNVNGTGARKTLGVRRSMDGWASRKGQKQSFKPPTMQRP